jgi:hypothetical protein
MSFISGAYTATLGGSDLGQIEAGFTIDHVLFKRLITGDNFGEGPQEGINLGSAVHIAYNLLEYNAAGAAGALWPYGTGYLTHSSIVGTQDIQSSLVASLILTALAGTPASATPASITLPRSILAEGFNVAMLFSPDLRVVPIRQRVYPTQSAPGAAAIFGTTT